MDIKKRYFDSNNKGNKVFYYTWSKEGNKAVVQITHGMAEHVERYEEFAKVLVDNGYNVYAHNHLGHKETSPIEEYGYFNGDNVVEEMTEDIFTLTKIAKSENKGKPIILFGHSMGSFFARNYAKKHSGDIDALIICGTAGPTSKLMTFFGKKVISSQIKKHGPKYTSKKIDNMIFGNQNKKCDDAKTEFDWLSRDEKEVQKYIDDEACGFLFTLSGYKMMLKLVDVATSKKWADGIRTDLPVLFIYGDKDPVGNYGKAVEKCASKLSKSNPNTTQISYKEARHELLNELSKEEVYSDILKWLEENIKVS